MGGKLLISKEEAEAISPTFAASLLADKGDLYGKRPHMVNWIFSGRLGDPTDCLFAQYLVVLNYTAYPSCRGKIHITSPTVGYKFQPNFMDNDLDMGKQVWAYKKMREIVRHLPYFAGELDVGQPTFSPSSPAALVSEAFATKDEIKDVVYTKEDDAAIEAFIRDRSARRGIHLGRVRWRQGERGAWLMET